MGHCHGLCHGGESSSCTATGCRVEEQGWQRRSHGAQGGRQGATLDIRLRAARSASRSATSCKLTQCRCYWAHSWCWIQWACHCRTYWGWFTHQFRHRFGRQGRRLGSTPQETSASSRYDRSSTSTECKVIVASLDESVASSYLMCSVEFCLWFLCACALGHGTVWKGRRLRFFLVRSKLLTRGGGGYYVTKLAQIFY